MKTSDLIQILTAFDDWVDDHENVTVAVETNEFGDQYAITLDAKRGYRIKSIHDFTPLNAYGQDYPLEIHITVPAAEREHPHTVKFGYYPEHQKLRLIMPELETEWDFAPYAPYI